MVAHVHDVTLAALDERIASAGEKLLIAYLWGPDCPNCVIFKSRLPKLLERLVDVDAELLEVDVYAHPEVATRYGVHGIPHFLLFKSGQKLGKMSEFRGESYWVSVVREHA
jgi:thioredoxin 1